MLKIISPLTQVDTYPAFTVGSKVQDKEGNEYIYLAGGTSVSQYSCVTYETVTSGSYGSVALLKTTGAVGPVAFSLGTVTYGKWGWFQVKGICKCRPGQAVTAGLPLYASGTVGAVMTDTGANDLIANAFAVSTYEKATAAGSAKVSINYPFCTRTLS